MTNFWAFVLGALNVTLFSVHKKQAYPKIEGPRPIYIVAKAQQCYRPARTETDLAAATTCVSRFQQRADSSQYPPPGEGKGRAECPFPFISLLPTRWRSGQGGVAWSIPQEERRCRA